MNREEIISGLQALLEESKVAESKIEYSYQAQRLERRVKELEEDIHNLKVILQNKGLI